MFGQPQSSPGGFGQPLAASSAASSSPFTFNTGGAFGASASSLFNTGGAFGASAPAFGQTGSSIFGQPQAKPFSGGLFGPQSSPGFNTPQSQSAFNAGSIFGQPSSPGIFGGQGAFNFSPQGGQQQQQAQQQLAPAQPLGEGHQPAVLLQTISLQCGGTCHVCSYLADYYMPGFFLHVVQYTDQLEIISVMQHRGLT